MAKIFGFDGTYNGLLENEAWERIYEYGKNFMPIKERSLQRKYNKIFSSKTKTIRDGKLKKINTERLVPGDIIVIESGEIAPVDGKILESYKFEFNNEYLPENEKFRLDGEGKEVIYQGEKVIAGKAVVEAIRSGEATYLSSIVKQIDRKNIYKENFFKGIHIKTNIIGMLGLILLLFGAIFSFVTTKEDIISKLSIASYSGLLLFLTTVPIGSCIMGFLKIVEQIRIIKKSNIIIKNSDILLKAVKTSVVCIDDRFLTQNYEKCIQRFYKAGIRVIIISNKGEQELRKVAKNAGICEKDGMAICGSKFENMNEDEITKVICEAIIFYEMNSLARNKVIEKFESLGINTIMIGDNISDLPGIDSASVGICTNDKRNSLEYVLSGAIIKGFSFSSIYSLIKGSFIVESYINQYSKYFLIFHLPIILNLLVALLSGISLTNFYFQTLMMVCVMIPLLLCLLNRNYSDDELFKLKEKGEKFIIDCIKCATIGFLIAVFNIFIFLVLNKVGFGTLFSVNSIVILTSIIYSLIIALSREKIKNGASETPVVNPPKEKANKVIKKGKIDKSKDKENKSKDKYDKKKKYEDLKDNIL